MALVQRLEAKQGQGLVVTPQLQQAIKLLQLSNLELETFVESELERNPLLARDEREGDREAISPEPEAASPVESAADETSASLVQADLDAPAEDQFESETSISSERPEEWSSWAGRGGSFEPEGGELGETPVRPPSLREHLEAQLASTRFSEAARAVAVQFIDAVDEGGYLRADPAEVGQRLGAPAALVTEVLETLQGFEPTGVFARSVAECLKLQLIERGRLDEPMSAMLLHLDLVARSDLVGLRRVCDVDGLKLNQMIAELRSLTPRPGAAFGGEPAQTVIPDVFVREMTNGTWRVELNSDTLPRLLVDRRYYAKVSAAARDENESGFLSGCLASANWLVKSLDQRARTILKVASEIVRRQDGFLAFGVEHLRPLNLKTVADAVGMHESTVSRVTANKYLATSRGVFEMRFFFTSAIAATEGGEAHSAEAVRHRIRQLVDAERSASEVHSDDAIVVILRRGGIDIARRTVAKYRDAMRIASSIDRKRRLQTPSQAPSGAAGASNFERPPRA